MRYVTLLSLLVLASCISGCGGCGDDSGLGQLGTNPTLPPRVGGIVFDATVNPAKPGVLTVNPLVLGAKDPIGTPMADIDVQLWRNGAMEESTTTNAAGEYMFDSATLLPQTSYQIRVPYEGSIQTATAIAPLVLVGAGFEPIPPNANPDDELDSDGDSSIAPGYSTAVIVTPAAGVDDFSVDFGFSNIFLDLTVD